MAISKMPRVTAEEANLITSDDDSFDFGDPEIIPVEIAPGKFLCLKEPSADDLIEIGRISDDKKISEVEATLQTICILHSPSNGQRKLCLKDAKKLRAKQLRKLGEAINQLLGIDQDAEP
jgi:hypothetical protein